MKAIYKIAFLVCVSAVATSCFDKSRPNYQYFPNMYEAVPYETYSESSAFRNGKEGQLPAEGSIPRGFSPYEYENTEEGYELAKANLKSPLDSTEVDMGKGAELYTIYCAICHGDKGDGKGNLAKREKFLGIPNYKERDITEGSVFHVETYGKNNMGSHANQLTQKERWQVAHYVMKLRSEL
ncbi:cytochrome c [Flavobacterium alkalisoli]|uniref:Cytochrome c, mono-and diheme variants family n=2 Tax=Flavobacterium TaxID=237 RepID=A0A444WBY7_9FLAO|nr:MULTISPECIES: cytochrome c [Flavobacterium]QEE49180.1 cytochrome c [Flavobacterium alkalisoli]RYJ43326.1 Cytochrome c, mono-and diheme variants family [Flavobacterium beibuense]